MEPETHVDATDPPEIAPSFDGASAAAVQVEEIPKLGVTKPDDYVPPRIGAGAYQAHVPDAPGGPQRTMQLTALNLRAASADPAVADLFSEVRWFTRWPGNWQQTIRSDRTG